MRFATQKTIMRIMSTTIKEAVCCVNFREPQKDLMIYQVKVGQRDSKRCVNWRDIVKNVAKF